MTDFSRRIKDLPPDKLDLLMQKVRKKGGNAAKGLIQRSKRSTNIFPLSFAQSRLWFLDQFEPGNPAYNVPEAFRVDGDLNLRAFRKALEAVVTRHEVLRTTFTTIEGEARQVIAEYVDIPFTLLYRRHQPESQILEAMAQEARIPFNLAQGPLLRATLIQVDEQAFFLLLVFHHIVYDGWSGSILLQEMSSFYSAFLAERAPQLPDLPIQYADYAVWQRQWLQGALLHDQLAYWKQHLADIPLLPLPVDHFRPLVQTFRGAGQMMVLPQQISKDLKTFAQQEGVTLFMVLLAAFKVLLHRYTGQSDLSVGTVVANRHQVELEKLIGFFVNTLVLRTKVLRTHTFHTVVQQVRRVCTEAYARQDIPFEKIVEALGLERDLSRSPLFQVLFVLQNTPQVEQLHAQLSMQPLELDMYTAKFDLAFFLGETEQGLDIEVEYNTDLFEAATIMRLLEHYRTLVQACIAYPDQSLATMPLLTRAEQRQILIAWNETGTEYADTASIHQLFEEVVDHVPEAPAVIFEHSCLTYRELNQQANRIAHYLQDQGVKRGERVGVYVERSAEMVASLLAILKVGAAYVPLDPSYPHDRLRFIIEDAGISILLTQEQLLGKLAGDFQSIAIDRDQQKIRQCSEGNIEGQITAKHLAYIIYTSGSTGMPKGVQISHTAVVNFLSAMSSRPGISSMERLLAVTSLSFDIAGLELFLPLINRACLIIASRSLASAGEKLMQALERLDITMMQATPSTWRMLVEAGWTGKRNLKILCGGEALPQELAAQLLTRGVSLWNLYGPTETTIWSTCQHIQSTFTPVSIGAPIANTEIYVVDASLEPVPVGVPGELYIGGQGVADGYLNRPALTAERFLPHPFSAAPGARLYKTGDLVRWRADGSLDYLGRLDNQVKLRGYRIEPGEIEATLQRHPAVLQSVVIPSQDQPDHRHLVAYIVIAPHTAVSSQHITEHVQQWQNVWDEAYHVSVSLAGFAFNISGWNSSYTHQPIPLEQMREWVEQTVKHIRTLHPQRVLEIGCGTGLLLFQLEPDCQLYWGTDISANGLHYIQQVCIQQKKQIPPLLQRAADDFTGIERGAFDTVILNSVIQYFPSVEYLFTVIQKAVQVLSPEGKIFIGDVRSLPLLELFHTSVQLATAADSVSLEQLLQRIGQQQADEQELVLAPAFFQALLLRLPQIRRLQIQLKRGRLHSEMTRFRYDVVLYLQELPPSYEIQWRDWRADQANVASFKEQLLVRKTEALGIRGVPNARLQTEIRASRLLTEMEKTRTALDLRNELRAVEREVGIDPEAFWALEQAGTHTIIINWSGEDYGCYDVVCLPLLAGAKPKGEGQRAPGFRPEQEVYANYPLQRSENMALIAEMREYLRLHLPDYMLPAHFVVVDSLPLTPNGKLDRSRLPHPIIARTGMREKFVAPRSVTEETLFQIWRQVLNLEQIGTHDNFFHLGGDSLLVIRIVARANQEGIRITTKQVFLHPTIAALAAVAGSSRLVAEQAPIIGPLSFMPSQSWFLEMDHQHLNYYNIEFLLEAQEKLDPALIKTVIACLLLQHDSLRLRLALEKKKPQLILAAPDERVPLRRVNIADLSAMEQEAAIEALVSEVQCSLDLENGLLFQAIFLERGAQKPDAVLFAAHYLLADLLSWQILLADFALAYQQLQHEGEINLPAKTTSVKQWVERLIDHVPIVIQQEQAYWLAEPRKHVSSLPLDFPAGANTVASSRSVVLQFSKEDTRVLLHGFPRLAGAQIDAVLLTALTEAFTRWTGSSTFLVELLGHGREALFEDMDLSHTIGSLNIMFPVLLEKDAAVSVPEMLKTIQAQLQAIPYHGIGYGILRYLSRAESLVQQLRSLPQPEVYFNYVGIMPAPSTFQIARGFGGHHLDRDALRPRLLEITAISLSEGYIELEWEYSENIYKPATIKRLACYMRDALQALVVHCLPPGSPGEKLWGESAQLLSTGTPRSDI